MHALSSIVLVSLALAQDEDPRITDAASGKGREDGGVLVDRGEALGFRIPDDEVLDFDVMVDVGVLGTTGMGSFQLSAGTEPFRRGLASDQPGEDGSRIGWIRGRAMGNYLNYRLDHVIEARVLPQQWPRAIYRDTQTGTENRRRELMYGVRDGAAASWYRSDRHCKKCDRPEHFVEGTWPFSADHHCEKCRRAEHRVWKKPETNPIPAGAVDMLSAVHLARSMVLSDLDELDFPLLDKDEWWKVTLRRGEVDDIGTSAGKYRCVAIKLDPVVPEGEDEAKFEGLFGIHGTLSIWLHGETGVPV